MTTFCIDFYESYLSTGRGERGSCEEIAKEWVRKGEDICENENEKGEEAERVREDRKYEKMGNKRVKDRRKKVEDRSE